MIASGTYLFEAIENRSEYPAKVFQAFIDHSSFHWHYEYELILVLKGKLLANSEQKQTILQTGDILLLNSRAVHELHRIEGEENICLFIQISQNLFSEFKDANQTYRFYLNSKADSLIPKKGFDHFIHLAAQIGLAELNKNEITPYRMKSMLYLLVADLYQYVSYDIYQRASKGAEYEDMATLRNILEYIQIHYQDEEILKHLYKEIGMGEKSVYRLLKVNTGYSAKDLILARRMDMAKYMLKYTDKPVNCIVDECGFGSVNSFYRSFKMLLNMAPNDYRKHGIAIKDNQEIKGYLGFNKMEGIALLENIVKKISHP